MIPIIPESRLYREKMILQEISRFPSSIGHPASAARRPPKGVPKTAESVEKMEVTGYEQNPDCIGNDACVRLVSLIPMYRHKDKTDD